MIDTVLNRFGGLLAKTFLFASFLPALFFVLGNLLVAILVIGPNAIAIWFGALDTKIQSVASGVLFIGILLIAYLFSSLRGVTLQLWAGSLLHIPYLTKGLLRGKREEYQKYYNIKFTSNSWVEREVTLRDQIAPFWAADIGNAAPLDETGHKTISQILGRLNRQTDPDEMNDIITSAIVPLFEQYNREELTNLYRHVNDYIGGRKKKVEHVFINNRKCLDLNYGPLETIQPTRLGNIIEAYNDYPYERYGIDGDVLWPRLVQVTPDSFNARIQDKKAFLDFALAMSTGAVLGAIAIPVYAPFLNSAVHWFVWFLCCISLIFTGWIFYTVAVAAARDFSHTLRAACDLFRLDLMAALGRPRPTDLETEKKQWGEIAQLASYGTVKTYSIRKLG